MPDLQCREISRFLGKFKNEDDFVEKFKVPESLLQQAYRELKKADIALQQKEWNAGKEEVKNRLKANIGRYLYTNNAVQKVIYSEDKELQKAVEITKGKIKKDNKSKK
jgi:hypothetical protein